MPATTRRRNAEQQRNYRARHTAYADPQTKRTRYGFRRWAQATLKVPTGRLAGQPFRIQTWQADWIRAANRPGIREAGLSVARKNGKSGLIAGWLLYQLVHAPRNWRCGVVSLTGALAKELLSAMAATAKASGIDCPDFYQTPPLGRVLGPDGRTVEAFAADRASGHGISLDQVIVDETGLLSDQERGLWNAMSSSVSGTFFSPG